MHIQGGAKPIGNPIYCGSKVKPPRNKVRGRPNQCFMLGRKTGFYAGILKGQQQAVPVMPVIQAQVQAQLPQLNNLSLGVLRDMLKRHLDANPELPRKYIISSGIYQGQEKGMSYLGKNDYIEILRRYGLGV